MLRSSEQNCGARLIELRSLRAGELSGETKSKLEAHLGGCEHCRARVLELEQEEAYFHANIDVAAESVRVVEQLNAPKKPGPWRLPAWISVPAAALALVIVVLVAQPKEEENGTRLKGASTPRAAHVELQMYVKDAAGIRAAADGARLREGDAIQFRYDAGGRDYLMVLSVDAGGTISPLYPDAERASIKVSPHGRHVLEGSIILDQTRGPERIFAFFSAAPLTFEEVKRELKEELAKESDVTRLQAVELEREDVAETSVLIIKE
jgi:hypothetical protein